MTPQAAGMDIFAALEHPINLPSGEIFLVPTGIAIALPPGFEAQIRPRSGLATQYGVTLIRGEIKVPLINLGKKTYTVHPGERIAQLVIAPVVKAEWKIVSELPFSERGRGGFGHTG